MKVIQLIIQLILDFAQIILDVAILCFVAKFSYDVFIKDEKRPHNKFEELAKI